MGGSSRPLKALALAVVGVAALGWAAPWQAGLPPHPPPPPGTLAALPRKMTIAVVNGNKSHQNGYAAVLYALSRMWPAPDVTLFRAPPSFGIASVTAAFFSGPTKPFEDFFADPCAFDAVVFATAPFDRMHPAVPDNLTARLIAPRLVFQLHNADSFDAHPPSLDLLRALQPGAVLAVAPHTAAHIRASLARHSLDAAVAGPVDYLVTAAPAVCPGLELAHRSGLVVQGKISRVRRNLTAVWSAARDLPAGSPLLPIRLVGMMDTTPRGRPALPADLLGGARLQVPFRKQPGEFPEYYGAVARGVALLPALPDPGTADGYDYFSSKSTSTVPVSLIALTPLVSTPRLLEAYAYLPPEATLRAADGTVGAAARALAEADYGGVLAALGRARDCVMARNAEVLARAVAGRTEGGPLPDRYCGEGGAGEPGAGR
ncbi:hypothetical protein DFJ74DRAFT_765292 [Hyaloraphidium curvatum]|nr:hypothetical protein DFJ74DRAFT_765292 [Hyaloraphidium curvatum]